MGTGRDLAVFLDHHRAIDALARAAAEHRVGDDAGEHVLESLREKKRFEILARFLRRRDIEIAVDCRRAAVLQRGDGREKDGGIAHHSISISACSAPAALIACRMEIMSRGPTPSALRLLTS